MCNGVSKSAFVVTQRITTKSYVRGGFLLDVRISKVINVARGIVRDDDDNDSKTQTQQMRMLRAGSETCERRKNRMRAFPVMQRSAIPSSQYVGLGASVIHPSKESVGPRYWEMLLK